MSAGVAAAFEPPIPSSAIFEFKDDKRTSLETYNTKYLKGHGQYKEIPFNESDASFGSELTLRGFSVLDAYKTATAAFIPSEFQHALILPEKDGEQVLTKFGKQGPFVSVSVKANYFDVGLLKSVEIVAAQEGADHVIMIFLMGDRTKIRYTSSLP